MEIDKKNDYLNNSIDFDFYAKFCKFEAAFTHSRISTEKENKNYFMKANSSKKICFNFTLKKIQNKEIKFIKKNINFL